MRDSKLGGKDALAAIAKEVIPPNDNAWWHFAPLARGCVTLPAFKV